MLAIYNSNKFSLTGDHEIGSKSFDIEDRFFGDTRRQYQLAYTLRMEHYKQMEKFLKDKRSKLDPSVNREEELERITLQQSLINEVLRPMIGDRESEPVEYCSLEKKGQRTRVGTLELVLQVLDPAELSEAPIPKFEKPKPQKYEIRLIIWEVQNLPLNGKKAIDIFFRATLDGDGWS